LVSRILSIVVESRIGKKRVVVIPKAIAEAVKIYEGQRIRIIAADNKIIIEPIRDAVWLAIHGKKIGRILPEEIEEESLREQEKLAK
jgi:AbrB family looped-hinge helix DNA binding protein